MIPMLSDSELDSKPQQKSAEILHAFKGLHLTIKSIRAPHQFASTGYTKSSEHFSLDLAPRHAQNRDEDLYPLKA